QHAWRRLVANTAYLKVGPRSSEWPGKSQKVSHFNDWTALTALDSSFVKSGEGVGHNRLAGSQTVYRVTAPNNPHTTGQPLQEAVGRWQKIPRLAVLRPAFAETVATAHSSLQRTVVGHMQIEHRFRTVSFLAVEAGKTSYDHVYAFIAEDAVVDVDGA